MSDWLFDHAPSFYPKEWDETHLSQHSDQYLLSDDGHLSLISAAKGGVHGPGSGGTVSPPPPPTISPPPPPPPPPTTGSPTSTLVGVTGGLQINLEWDLSVQTAPNWSDIEHAVVSAAQIYTSAFSNHAVLNIAIGLGEVNGQAMNAGALGETQTTGYAVSYASLTSALGAADAGLVSSGLMAAGAVTADAALAGKTFFVPGAEAKALGLASATSSSIDGYIGLIAGGALSFVGAPGGGQYDAVGVAAHEISEVMGRIGLEGSQGYVTPLDIFRYTGLNQPGVAPGPGYFSTDMGLTALNTYNNPLGGGDAADWASLAQNANDAYDAFDNPGVTTVVTRNDLIEVAALGYKPVGTLATVTA